MKELIEGIMYMAVAIVLLVLSIRILEDSSLFNNAQYIILIIFSLSFALLAYKDKLCILFKNKDDT